GQEFAAIPIDRHHGPQGAIASPQRTKADLAQGGCAGAGMGAQPAGQTARRSGGAKQLRQTLEVTSRTADTINQWRPMLDVYGGPAGREARSRVMQFGHR